MTKVSSDSSRTARVISFDMIKTLAMFLVVFIHYTFYSYLYPITALSQALSSATTMGVPLFLMVNGALVLSKPFDSKKDLHRLLHTALLIVVWKLISAIVMGLIIGTNPLKNGMRSFIAYILFGNLDGFNLGHFWFMYALLAIYLLVPLLKCATSNNESASIIDGILMTLIILIFVRQALSYLQVYLQEIYAIPTIDIDGFYHINPFGEYGYALCYFLLGYRLFTTYRNMSDTPRTTLLIKAIVVFVISWFGLIIEQRYQQLAYGVTFYVQDGYTNILVLIMSSSLFMALLSVQKVARPLERACSFIGSHTLGVYFLHMFFLTLEGQLIAPITGRIDSLAVNFTIIIATYSLCLLATYLIEQIPPLKKILF